MASTRRDFLKVAAMLSGAAGVSGVVPDSIRRAFAIEPEAGSTYMDAEHIVILMQENRSFDHALGTLQGVRGFNDPRAIRQASGNSIFVQTDAAGDSYAPWRLDIKDTRITWMGSIPHSRQSQVDAWNEGHHDKWIEAKRSGIAEYAHMPLTMGHYTREDLPFYYALADAFTVCDQHYCSVMTSTSPNRCASIRSMTSKEAGIICTVVRIASISGGCPGGKYPMVLDCIATLSFGLRQFIAERELQNSPYHVATVWLDRQEKPHLRTTVGRYRSAGIELTTGQTSIAPR